MAISTKLYLDTRRVRADGNSQLKLNVSVNRKTTQIPMGIALRPVDWDSERERILSSYPSSVRVNVMINERRNHAEMALFELQDSGELSKLPITEVRRRVLAVIDPGSYEPPKKEGTLQVWFRRFMATKTERTLDLYERTLKKVLAFDKDVKQLNFEDVKKDWLLRFDAFLAQTAPSRNARNIHLRNIRAVFNYAIDNEVTTCYPFRRFSIRNERTRKRSLSVEDLRKLFSMDVEPGQVFHRDMFKLMFMLIGINAKDLFYLTDVVDGRIEYRRAKTGRLYSIKVEPEIAEMLERYKGERFLLSPADRWSDYRDFTKHVNMQLKKIGKRSTLPGRGAPQKIEPLWPELSTYWARHSWATVARRIGISKDDIALALGHGGNSVTDIYIDEDMGAVDVANRKVLDYVFGGAGPLACLPKGY